MDFILENGVVKFGYLRECIRWEEHGDSIRGSCSLLKGQYLHTGTGGKEERSRDV